MGEQVVTVITTIALVSMAIAGTIIVVVDVARLVARLRVKRYQSSCKHEDTGRIFDENVCMYCGKTL